MMTSMTSSSFATSRNPVSPVTSRNSVTLSDLTEFFVEIEEMAALFYSGMLADDLDSDREEHVTSHRDLLHTLNPGIVGMIYHKTGREELVILQFKDRVEPVNISRLSDEDVTRALMDCAWGYASKESTWGYANKEG